MSVTEVPLTERLRDAALVEFMGAPIIDPITFKCQKSMSVGLRKCAMAHGLDLSALVRLLIRAGAEQYGIDLTHTSL
jgi:hypothetical protein